MIKFFRRIRQKLLTENLPAMPDGEAGGQASKISKPASPVGRPASRTGRYLLYAIGEILLVVIGIMIALSVNNKNQERAQEKEIVATLIEIQRDIISDNQFSTYFINGFIKQDSVKNFLMNNKVSYDDVKTGRVRVDLLALRYNGMKMQTNGYKQFSSKIDKMPTKYKDLVSRLNELYQSTVTDIENDFLRYRETVLDNNNRYYNQFDWYSQGAFKGEMNEEEINYYLQSKAYKRDAMNSMYNANELVKSIFRWKHRSIEIYFMIDEILDGQGYDTPEFMRTTSLADSSHAVPLVGKYEQISGPLGPKLGAELEITSIGKQLYVNTQSAKNILLRNNENGFFQYTNIRSLQFYINDFNWFECTILMFNENGELTIIGQNLDKRKWKRVTKVINQ